MDTFQLGNILLGMIKRYANKNENQSAVKQIQKLVDKCQEQEESKRPGYVEILEMLENARVTMKPDINTRNILMRDGVSQKIFSLMMRQRGYWRNIILIKGFAGRRTTQLEEMYNIINSIKPLHYFIMRELEEITLFPETLLVNVIKIFTQLLDKTNPEGFKLMTEYAENKKKAEELCQKELKLENGKNEFSAWYAVKNGKALSQSMSVPFEQMDVYVEHFNEISELCKDDERYREYREDVDMIRDELKELSANTHI